MYFTVLQSEFEKITVTLMLYELFYTRFDIVVLRGLHALSALCPRLSDTGEGAKKRREELMREKEVRAVMEEPVNSIQNPVPPLLF